MAALILFHCLTVPGGVLSDLDRGDARLAHRRENHVRGEDSTIRWAVELWCEGDEVPTDPERARGWLIELEPVVRTRLGACAVDLDHAVEDPDRPNCVRFCWDQFHDAPPGVRLGFTVSKNRNHCPDPFAEVVRGFAAGWWSILLGLKLDDPDS